MDSMWRAQRHCRSTPFTWFCDVLTSRTPSTLALADDNRHPDQPANTLAAWNMQELSAKYLAE
eukprot:15436097-Alexandrium_andersonii.AAC.1